MREEKKKCVSSSSCTVILLKAVSAAGRKPIIIFYSFSRCDGYSDSVHEDQAGNSSPRYSPVNFVWNPLVCLPLLNHWKETFILKECRISGVLAAKAASISGKYIFISCTFVWSIWRLFTVAIIYVNMLWSVFFHIILLSFRCSCGA